MPEIAEVRTVAKTLNERIVGEKIIGIDIYYDGIIQDNIDYFIENVVNRTITRVHNYGKYFIKRLGHDLLKHEHIIFNFLSDLDLRYHDTRKFGTMRVVNTSDIYDCSEIKKLGIEPDSDKLTKEYIYNSVCKSKKPIKTLLLDQTIINGLGNIYVDEVLHASKLNPETLGCNITLEDSDNIRINSKEIIEKATLGGGTTIRSYTSSLNVYGTYQEHLKVHTKDICGTCGEKIQKIRVGGRGTYFCPKCQIKK